VILGVLAVVLAITVPALAGSTFNGKITKAKVRTIARNQVRKLAPELNVNEAKIATNVLSANVLGNGTVLRSIPSGATATRISEGEYRVNLGREIADCTISTSAASNGDPDNVVVGVGVADATTLSVRVATVSGFHVIDAPFYVQAICPPN
jgi:hypothetical protein